MHEAWSHCIYVIDPHNIYSNHLLLIHICKYLRHKICSKRYMKKQNRSDWDFTKTKSFQFSYNTTLHYSHTNSFYCIFINECLHCLVPNFISILVYDKFKFKFWFFFSIGFNAWMSSLNWRMFVIYSIIYQIVKMSISLLWLGVLKKSPMDWKCSGIYPLMSASQMLFGFQIIYNLIRVIQCLILSTGKCEYRIYSMVSPKDCTNMIVLFSTGLKYGHK